MTENNGERKAPRKALNFADMVELGKWLRKLRKDDIDAYNRMTKAELAAAATEALKTQVSPSSIKTVADGVGVPMPQSPQVRSGKTGRNRTRYQLAVLRDCVIELYTALGMKFPPVLEHIHVWQNMPYEELIVKFPRKVTDADIEDDDDDEEN